MQQQSINLGCSFNPWPLDSELWSTRLIYDRKILIGIGAVAYAALFKVLTPVNIYAVPVVHARKGITAG
jgi:hypothetical protein